MTRLPSADHQYPTCGACAGETYCEDLAYLCDDCLLVFDQETLEASREDDTEPICGATCDNTWHRDGAIKPGATWECGTCQLTVGHTSDHWTGCEPNQSGDQS